MKSKNRTPKVTAGINYLLSIVLLLMLLAQVAGASSSEVIIPDIKARAEYSGYSFTEKAEKRIYNFTLHIDNSTDKVASSPTREKTIITWDSASQTLTVHNEMNTRYFDHQKMDVIYKSNHDPILDPASDCHYISHTPYQETYVYKLGSSEANKVVVFNPIYIFDPTTSGSIHLDTYRNVISGSRLLQLRLEAMARSLTPDVAKTTKMIPADVMLRVKVAADIPRQPKQPVDFFVVRQDQKPLLDVAGKKIKMPITARFVTNNTAFHTISNLPEGKYLFYASLVTSLTSSRKSKKVPFEVKGQVSPHGTPVIVSPREKQTLKKGDAMNIKVVVSFPMFNTGFDAEVEVEHSRLARQTPYSQYKKLLLKNRGKESTVDVQFLANDKSLKPVTGDFRLRARMIYQGKPTGEWSKWRHIHIGGKAIPHFQQDLMITSPSNHQFINGDVPVKITFSKPGQLSNPGQFSKLSIILSFQEETVPNKNNPFPVHHLPFTVDTYTIDLGPEQSSAAETYSRNLLLSRTKSKPGEFTLKAELSKPGQTTQKASRSFHLTMLGNPVNNNQQTKSASLRPHFISQPIPAAEGLRQTYHIPAKVSCKVKNISTKELLFELRRQPPGTSRFQMVKRPTRKLTQQGKNSNMILTIKEKGKYQIRFRRKANKIWGGWQTFKVEGKTAPRMINPQPEPPGRQLHTIKNPTPHFNPSLQPR